MKFKSLSDRMLYLRGLTDYKLIPGEYVMLMLDGRSFSKVIKNRFKKPFDSDFIDLMNDTAAFLCGNIQGAKLAYTQSDEISIVLSDFDTIDTESFFNYRLSKILSISASLATSYFQSEMMTRFPHKQPGLYQFDCKAWNLPGENDVYAWMLYRQNDCIRNSVSQAAQSGCSRTELHKKNQEEQKQILLQKTGISWESDYNDGEKYGRFIYKEKEMATRNDPVNPGSIITYERTIWKPHYAFRLSQEEGKKKFIDILNNNEK